jgi:signal peptidase
MKKALKIILDVLAWVLLILALLVTLIVFAADKHNGVANIFGYTPLTVESDSMSPTFKEKDLIISKKVDDLYKLKVGDVITFHALINGQNALNTHRIVSINDTGNSIEFITRGDNNSIDDSTPVKADEIVGKWTGVRLKGAGKVMDFLRTKKGFFICIIIPLALFFLFELYKFIVVLIDAKKSDITEEDEEEIKRKAVEEYIAAQKAKEAGAAKNGETAEAAEDASEEKKDDAESDSSDDKTDDKDDPENK